MGDLSFQESPVGANQRAQFHVPARVHAVKYGPDGVSEGVGVQVVTHNISRSGLGFLSQTPLEEGQRVHLYLKAGRLAMKRLSGEIVRCRSQTDNWYESGMHFSRESQLEESPLQSFAA